VVDDEEGVRPARTEWHMRRLQALAGSINGAALRHTIAIVNNAGSDVDGAGRRGHPNIRPIMSSMET
jgi:hypothetical protein